MPKPHKLANSSVLTSRSLNSLCWRDGWVGAGLGVVISLIIATSPMVPKLEVHGVLMLHAAPIYDTLYLMCVVVRIDKSLNRGHALA
jgi:hypothetical protein